MSYEEQLELIEHEYGTKISEELPNEAAYLRTFVGSKKRRWGKNASVSREVSESVAVVDQSGRMN